MATTQFGVTAMPYGYSSFLPTIIAALEYSGVHSQLLTIPCYTCVAIVYCIAAFLSDKTQKRGPFALAGSLVTCTGYAILLGTPQCGAGAQCAGCIVVVASLYISVGIPLSWLPNSIPTSGRAPIFFSAMIQIQTPYSVSQSVGRSVSQLENIAPRR